MKQPEANLVYETHEYRCYRVKAFYEPDSTTSKARIEIWKGEERIQTGFCPAYKVWNYYAHATDIIDDLIGENEPTEAAAPETAAERDRLKASNKELLEALEEIGRLWPSHRARSAERNTMMHTPITTERLAAILIGLHLSLDALTQSNLNELSPSNRTRIGETAWETDNTICEILRLPKIPTPADRGAAEAEEERMRQGHA
jgi:hypothetical protein